jgi:uncharacterized protein YndB with AHSA1/START domain
VVATPRRPVSVERRRRIDQRRRRKHAGNLTTRYAEIVRPERLVFSWDWEHPDDRIGDTLVTVTFEPLDATSTNVRIVHEGFVADQTADNHADGWSELLRRLQTMKEIDGDDA